jgi:hypothetical protein
MHGKGATWSFMDDWVMKKPGSNGDLGAKERCFYTICMKEGALGMNRMNDMHGGRI